MGDEVGWEDVEGHAGGVQQVEAELEAAGSDKIPRMVYLGERLTACGWRLAAGVGLLRARALVVGPLPPRIPASAAASRGPFVTAFQAALLRPAGFLTAG